MPPYREDQLRRLVDQPTNKMIDQWSAISQGIVGRPIEVVVDNRRNHPVYRRFTHEVNTAIPAVYKGQVVLSVWLESFPKLDLVSHEIGHWVLKLKGFSSLSCQPPSRYQEYLNSLASHPPLYDFQRRLGSHPEVEIEARTDHDIRLCLQPKTKEDQVASALYLSDDLLNCSQEKREELRCVVSNNYPQVMMSIQIVLDAASKHNLLDPVQNLMFRKSLADKLKLYGRWSEARDVSELKDLENRTKESTRP